MANSQFTPYVSEFEYASRFHPSKNPDCPIGWSGNSNEGEEKINERHFKSSRYRRSPEEGSPVGQEPSIEVRAVLVRCPKTNEDTDDVLINRNIYNITAGRSQDILDFHGFDRDEPTPHSEVRDCRRKLVITMKFNNIGRTKTKEEFVVIDHVLDPVTMHKARLLNPFVVKVRQEPVLQLYGLKFHGVVNAEAKEEVLSNKQSNYTGCDDTSANPTCGQMFFEDNPIPYSQGFCCSCDPEVNVQRQASTLNETVSSSFPSFFSKSKDRFIKPFKTSRSVRANVLDDLSDNDELSELSYSREMPGNILESSKDPNLQQNFHPIESNSTLVENSYKDERDLMNLKDTKSKSEDTRRSSVSRSNEFENKNSIESYDSPSWIASSLTTNLSGNAKSANAMDDGRGNVMSDKDAIVESRRKEEEKLAKRKSNLNIINELTKLEEDYKKFQLSSAMRDNERGYRGNDNGRISVDEKATLNNGQDQGLNIDYMEKFRPIESIESKVFTKHDDNTRNLISTSTMPYDAMTYDGNSTLSVDVIFAYKPRDELTINRVNSTLDSPNIFSSEVPQSEAMMTRPFFKTQSIAVLWQKLASDSVDPSHEKTNDLSRITKSDKDRFYSNEMTTSSNEKFESNVVADLTSNNVMLVDAKLRHDNNLQSSNKHSRLEDTENTMIFDTSISNVSKNDIEITLATESTVTADQRNEKMFTLSHNELSSNNSKDFPNSTSSFSSVNFTKSDAIVLSGSLIKQLGDWLTYDNRRKYETRGGKENQDAKIEFENKDDAEAEKFASLENIVAKKNDRFDQSNTAMTDRRPIEIHVETIYDRKSSNGIDDKMILPIIRSRNEKSSRRASRDYSSPEKFDVVARKKTKRWNFPRSYRSIAEDDRFFAKDNDRQRSIDKKIEDEFEEISDVLKDAGDGPKIIREKPKSDETFEKDDSVMEKFASIFNEIPKDIADENYSKIYTGSFEAQTIMSANMEDDEKILQNEKDKVRKMNDRSKIGRFSHENSAPMQDNVELKKIDTVIGNSSATEPIIEDKRVRVIDRETTLKISKNTHELVEPVSVIPQTTGHRIIIDRFKLVNEYKSIPENHEQSTGFTNVSVKIRNLTEKESTTRHYEPTLITKNESSSEPSSVIPLTAGHEMTVDGFKIFKEFQNVSNRNNELPKQDSSSNSRKFTNTSLETEKDVSSNNSLPNTSSSILTIEKLKKQLRKEAKNYALLSQSRSTAAGSNPRDVEKNWKYGDGALEVNTKLTPAEKVEDFFTDEETLPPDDETNYTTSHLSKTTNFPFSVTTTSLNKLVILHSSDFPRYTIPSFERYFPKRRHNIPLKNTTKVFLFPEESSTSSSMSLRSPKNERNREESVHRRRRRRRHRHQRRNRNSKKHLTKNKRNLKRDIVTTPAGRSFAGEKSENEDDENSWYDTTIKQILTVSKDRTNDTSTTTTLSSTISSISYSHKNQKRRYHEIPVEQVSNGDQQTSNSEVIGSSEPNFNMKSESLDLPLNLSPKGSMYQGFVRSGNETDVKKNPGNTKPEVTTRRSSMNLKTLTARKFPSFYPKSSDIIAMSKNVRFLDRDNKRDDTMDINENEDEALIFYDYEDSKDRSIDDDVNADGKRSLDNIVPAEIRDGIEPSEGWKEKMELLKLKKHADVLKEYLNWRQDVVPPESHENLGYTTRISMAKGRPKGLIIHVTTPISNEADGTTLTGEESTYSTITETFFTPVEQETDAGTLKCSDQQNDITEDTEAPKSLKNFGKLNVMDKVDRPAGCSDSRNNDNTRIESIRYDEEASTGRILPPCNSKIEFSKNINAQFSNRLNVHTDSESEHDALPKIISDHRGGLSDMENDLVVISLLEKSLLGNKNFRGRQENRDSLARIYQIHEGIKSTSNSRQRRHRFKKTNSNSKSDKRRKRVPGRRLMSVQSLDDYNENYEEDLRFENTEENNDVESSNLVNLDNSDDEKDGAMLERKWNDIIEKIIHENSSESSGMENTTIASMKEIPGDNLSVLKQLHFYNADKYIRRIAKKIVHNSNIHDPKDEKDVGLDKIVESRRKGTLVGRKLKQYPDKSMTWRRFKTADSHGSGDDSSKLRLNSESKNHVANVTFDTEHPGRKKDGRDFAISLSGKIHVEGGTNGQPISISFDTSPDTPKTNGTVRLASNETARYAIDTKTDVEKPQSTNFLSNLFNIASVPKELDHNSLKDNKATSPNVPSRESVRAVRDDKFQTLRDNRYKKFSDFTKKVLRKRKSRAVIPQTAKRYTKHREGRSYDLKDSQDSMIAEDSNDYPESSNEDEYDSNFEVDDDSSAVSSDRGTSESERYYSNVDGHNRLNSPEVGVIKIIPLNVEKSLAQLTSQETSQENQQDTKVSRMIASQLPKMTNDDMPKENVKPGKIKPAILPWRENDNYGPEVVEPMEKNLASKFSESYPSHPFEQDKPNELDSLPLDGQTSTNNPMNLRVIGLVSMGQPTMNEPKNLKANFDPNYKIAPLIHVKIQQQSDDNSGPDHNIIIPLNPENHPEGCPKIEMTHSKNVCGDNSLHLKINNDRNKAKDENIMRNPVITIQNMVNSEELREPVGTCSGSNKFDGTRPAEELSPCQSNRNTLPIASAQDTIGKSELRKKIRMKNMLAILEFMKKINKIMNVGGENDFPNEDYNDAVIKLQRVIILPKNRSDGIFGCHEEPETDTNRVVLIDEGVGQQSPCGGTSSNDNSRLSARKGINETIGYPNRNSIFNETRPFNKSLTGNKKNTENNQDQNFLFFGKNDKLVGKASGSDDISNDNQFFMNLRNIENMTIFGGKEENDSSSDSSLSNSTNPLGASFENLSAYNEATVGAEPGDNSRSNERIALKNFERKIDDRLRDLRRENSADYVEGNIGKMKKRMRRVSVNKRKATDNDFYSFPKIKRHRLTNRLSSHRNVRGFRQERDADGQIYGSQLSSGIVSYAGDQSIGRFAAANDNPEEKRKKKKKKRRRKKKRKKKKKKKQKGKSRSEAANSGKGWWPFGRQLMSLSEKRHVVLDSNFDRRRLERAKTNKCASCRFPFSLEHRKIRRVYHAKYPRGNKRKTKNNREHKKGRKKKKKKKKKKTKKIKGQEKKTSGRDKRQIKPGGTQARGGQDCMDRRHPSNVNPVKYLESSHCLRFSDLWQEIINHRYSAYELEKPIMEHTVYLQLFEKHSLADGTTHWDDLTQGTMVRMGTFMRHQRDDKPTIVFTYSGARMESQKRALNLDPARQRLLIPSPVPPKKASEYPAVRGPGEYLVVQTSAISKDGKECDKAGVGFTAFAKQENRCGRVKGTCLKNQPLAYWRHDMEARDSGRPGCYFLSNFATVPTNPIKYNVSGAGSREYLALEYHSAHVSAIDIEVRTDYNAIVRVGSSGRLTEVYVDSTSLEHTVVTVVISNMGLASSPYQPRITDCPSGLPVSWTKAKGIMQVIPPQHDQRVTLDLYGQLLLNGFHCSVEVVNHRGELVAMRRIRVQKMDRCFCVWHCLCACVGSVNGMGCQPMSPEHYHAAGFQGPVPVITEETSMLMNIVKDVVMLSALLLLLLIFLGLLKWFVGIFAPTVGRWGLDSLLQSSRIKRYLEPELRCRCIVTDDDGVPVHPDTGQRTVRLCSRKLEFFLNMIFFLTYPIAMCCGYFKKSMQSSRQHHCCPDESKMCLINENSSCPKMICVSTYGDSRNSKLEAEDTRYVMNELKKSQESLENPKGTKKKDGRRSDKALSRKSSHKSKSILDMTAKRLVDDLLKKRTVFRNLTQPIGGLAVPSGTFYSLRGYFLNAENGGYRFITPCPFKQHWLIENNQKKSSKPPEIYPSNLFMCSYGTARDVYNSNEISLSPKGICINVQYLDEK